jgi:hypothetical protein
VLLRVEGFDVLESVEAVEVAERESWRACVGGEIGERRLFSSLIGVWLMASSDSESVGLSCFHGLPQYTSWGIELDRSLGLRGVAGLISSCGIGPGVDGNTSLSTPGCGR